MKRELDSKFHIWMMSLHLNQVGELTADIQEDIFQPRCITSTLSMDPNFNLYFKPCQRSCITDSELRKVFLKGGMRMVKHNDTLAAYKCKN